MTSTTLTIAASVFLASAVLFLIWPMLGDMGRATVRKLRGMIGAMGAILTIIGGAFVAITLMAGAEFVIVAPIRFIFNAVTGG